MYIKDIFGQQKSSIFVHKYVTHTVACEYKKNVISIHQELTAQYTPR